VNGRTLALTHRSISIVADERLDVCDGAHWAFVMKKSQRPRPSPRDRTGHPPAITCRNLGNILGCAGARCRKIPALLSAQ
jgi:hypothetical protein